MCINSRWITNKITKQRIFVPCGSCPACKQAKAQARTLRIKLQTKYNVPDGYVNILTRLGYDNEHIPFILKSDYERFINREQSTLPIYRNRTIKLGKKYISSYSRIDAFENYSYKTDMETHYFDYLSKLQNSYYKEEYDVNTLPEIRLTKWYNGKHYYDFVNGRVGVLYYHDIQNFIKLLRINLERDYGIKQKFNYICVGEYGPTSFRPHFHILFQIPTTIFKEFKSTFIKSWKFEDIRPMWKQKEQFKITSGSESYVSSYVNCSTDFPVFFKTFRPFRQQHTFSKDYGLLSNYCKLPKILEMAKTARFTFKRIVKINGVQSVIDCPLPSFVINRYFPKFKGYSRLTDFEIFSLFTRYGKWCQGLKDYAKTLGYTSDDLHTISVSIKNHFFKYCKLLKIPIDDMSLYLYINDYIRVWRSYYSYLTINAYEKIEKLVDYVYHFINWSDKIKIGDYELDCFSIHELAFKTLETLGHFVEKDPNKFPQSVALANTLTEMYYDYDKTKKVKNEIYSKYSNL